MLSGYYVLLVPSGCRRTGAAWNRPRKALESTSQEMARWPAGRDSLGHVL